MFTHLQGEWVSVSSEVPAYEVGKDCVRFQADGYIEYSIEHEGRILKSLFEAKKDGEEYIIRPLNGFLVGDSLRIKISTINENEIGIERIGMTTVYRKKTEPNQAPQTTICTVTERAPSSTLRASADRV
jgi:hypothetical protein